MFSYCALDVETTSLETKFKNLLQVSLVVDDLSVQAPLNTLPHLTFYVSQRHGYSGQPFALAMNSQILYTIADAEKSGKVFPGPYYNKLMWPTQKNENDPYRLNDMADDLEVLLTLKPEDYCGKYPTLHDSHVRMFMGRFLHKHFGDKLPTVAGFNAGSFDVQFFNEDSEWAGPLFHHRSIEVGSLFMNWTKGPGSSNEVRKKLGLEGGVAHDAYLDNMDTILAVRDAYNRSK